MTVTERLSGRAEAVAAILFALFVLAVMIDVMMSLPALLLVLGAIWLIEASLIVAVIHNTWRTTTLHADSSRITLRFKTPLTRRREISWAVADIEGILVLTTSADGGLAEIEIRPVAGAPAKLFTDHRQIDLNPIAADLHNVIGRNGRGGG